MRNKHRDQKQLLNSDLYKTLRFFIKPLQTKQGRFILYVFAIAIPIMLVAFYPNVVVYLLIGLLTRRKRT